MTTQKQMETKEFKEGFNATKVGERSPYRSGSYQDELWFAGYSEAFLTGKIK